MDTAGSKHSSAFMTLGGDMLLDWSALRLLVGAAIVTMASTGDAWAVNCADVPANDCTTTACTVECNESALRTAVDRANGCTATATFARTITFNVGCEGCTIPMVQTAGSVASCATEPDVGRNSVCLTGHHIVIDGQNAVTFTYVGDVPCATCPVAYRPGQPGEFDDVCNGNQPALFTLMGHHNVVKNFTMKYFPDGLHIRDGATFTHDNLVENVTSSAVCGAAVTIDGIASDSAHTLKSSDFTGATTAEPPRKCWREQNCSNHNQCVRQFGCFGQTVSGTCECSSNTECHTGSKCRCRNGLLLGDGETCAGGTGTCHFESACGLQTAVKITARGATVGGATAADGNTIDAFRRPLRASGVGHDIAHNTTDGRPAGCAAYPSSCTASSTCATTCEGYEIMAKDSLITSNVVEYCEHGITASHQGTGTIGGILVADNTFRYNYINGIQAGLSGRIRAQGNKLKENGCWTGTSFFDPKTALAIGSSAIVDSGGGDASGSCVTVGGICSLSPGGNAFCQSGSPSDIANSGNAGARDNCFDDTPPPTPVVSGTAVPTTGAASCTATGFAACSTF